MAVRTNRLIVYHFLDHQIASCYSLQKIAKTRAAYFLRAHFWLDTIACLSLLPDTWLAQDLDDPLPRAIMARTYLTDLAQTLGASRYVIASLVEKVFLPEVIGVHWL
eukprot:2229805-Amphidinium_carterae.1